MSLGFVVWVVIGVIVASNHHYLESLKTFGAVLSAVLAILLWPLILLDLLLDVYAKLLAGLHVAGCEWVQLDEPVLAADRSREELEALRHAYHRLGSLKRRPALLVSTYFGEIRDALGVLAASPVEAIGLDFVAGPGSREALAGLGGLGGKTLVAVASLGRWW